MTAVEVAMDEVREKGSPRPITQDGNFDHGESMILRGVDSRDTVLQQLHDANPLDVVVLDSDEKAELPSPYSSSLAHREQQSPLLRQRCHGEVPDIPIVASTMQIRDLVVGQDGETSLGCKKRLFESTGAKENMYKAMTLPTPPDSNGGSLNGSFDGEHSPNHTMSSWNFDSLYQDRSMQAMGEPENTRFTCDEAPPLSFNSLPAASQAELHSGAMPAWKEPFQTRSEVEKERNEASGVMRSQLLREARKARTNEKPNTTQSRKHIAETVHHDQKRPRDTDSEVSDRIIRALSQSGSLPDLEQIWNQREDALSPTEPYRNSGQGTRPKTVETSMKQAMPRCTTHTREAAETYPNQSRHFGNASADEDAEFWNYVTSNPAPEPLTTERQKVKEERVARIRANAMGGVQEKKRKQSRELANPARPAKRVQFFAPDLEKGRTKASVSSRRSPAQTREDVKKMMGTAQKVRPRDPDEVDVDDAISRTLDLEGETSAPVMSLSVLEQLGRRHIGPSQVKSGAASKSRDIYSQLRPQGEGFNLPLGFAKFTDARKERITRREILRERQKDLQAIADVYQKFARLLAVDTLQSKHMNWLEEVKKFTEAVLVQGKSGRYARRRVLNIKDSVKRNLRALEEPDKDKVQEMLADILQRAYYEQIEKELPEVQAELAVVIQDCQDFYEARRVMASGESKRRTAAAKTKLPTAKLTRSDHYEVRADRDIQALRAKLARFNRVANDDGQLTDLDENELEIVEHDHSQDEADGAISEEDKGEDIMLPRGRTLNPATGTHQIFSPGGDGGLRSFDRNHSRANITAPSAQAVDKGLLEEMAERRRRREHIEEQGAQNATAQLVLENHTRKAARAAEAEAQAAKVTAESQQDETDGTDSEEMSVDAESAQEFDDSDLEVEDMVEDVNDDDDEGPSCKRYIAKMFGSGLGSSYDEEQLLGNYLNRNKAKKKVNETARWAMTNLSGRPGHSPSYCSSSFKDDGHDYEHQILLDEDGQTGCRIWIEEETYSPSKEAYKKSKVRQACEPPKAWFVDWENTIGPCEDTIDDDAVEETQHITQQPIDADDNKPQPCLSLPADDTEEFPVVTENPVLNAKSSEETQLSIGEPEVPQADSEPPSLSSPTNYTAEFPNDANDSTTDDGLDHLFGPAPDAMQSPPSSPPTNISPDSQVRADLTVITRMNGDGLRMYTELSDANRQAKRVFMTWFIKHLPAASDRGYIEQQDNSIEEQLEAMGSRMEWSREEDFNFIDDAGSKKNDKMRVWVRKARAKGPSN